MTTSMCMYGMAWSTCSDKRTGSRVVCRNKALVGSVLCEEHRAQSLARVKAMPMPRPRVVTERAKYSVWL